MNNSQVKYKVMILGSGGRENAMAHYLEQDCEVYVLSNITNPQLYNLINKRYITGSMDLSTILKMVLEVNPDLVIVGSETLLAEGVSNFLVKKGIFVMSPNKNLAKIESSKIFARRFLKSLNLDKYNPDYMVVEGDDLNKYNIDYMVFKGKDLENSGNFWDLHKGQVVIKQDSSAGGKGVFVANDHFSNKNLYTMQIASARDKGHVLLEEKLSGIEFSLITLRDRLGHCHHFPPVRNFKRRYNDDSGPNTAGMGSISLIINESDQHFINEAEQLNKIVLNELEGVFDDHYVGFLCGCYMLTDAGLKVIKFNAGMRDPEAIGLFKSLKTRPYALIKHFLNNSMDELKWEFNSHPYVIKYLVSERSTLSFKSKFNYPSSKNIEDSVWLELYEKHDIDFLKEVYQNNNVSIYEADLHICNNFNYLGGLRPLAVICYGNDHISASLMINKIFDVIQKFNKHLKLNFRGDIGSKSHHYYFEQSKAKHPTQFSYAESGVNVDTNQDVVKIIKDAVVSTHLSRFNLGKFCSGYGQFAGMIKLSGSKRLFGKNAPIIAATTDGTGTKSLFVNAQLGISGFYNLGQDLVNHCVNDLMVQGAKPVFFQDYFASSLIKPNEVKTFIEGCAAACIENNCIIAGGETAEMPDVYLPGVHDLVGTMVGIVNGKPLNPVKNIKKGDIALALPSSGPHTNGYSLIRKLIKSFQEKGEIIPHHILQEWLRPHRSYKKDFDDFNLLKIKVKGYAHITGGGLIENPPRILPDNLGLEIDTKSWVMPLCFDYIQKATLISDFEMRKTFNCGIGLIIILDPKEHLKLIKKLSIKSNKKLTDIWTLGKVVNKKISNTQVYFI